ncbi:orotidine-5'-phosphate decarboxylase [Candidatus Woesearchaeota archaeon]|nr:orotidine-5'-phosphate decarboxylase [Candidatus Woesearchaeota archaeon]
MNFPELLENMATRNNSIVCFGVDPVIERIPVKGSDIGKRIVKFYTELLAAVADEIAAVKPNYAFFAQYGFEGLKAMETLIAAAKKKKLPVILDAKRGDTGKSSEAYSKEVFEAWKADAVTVSPYMGADSVAPFINYCGKGKGVYVLVKTSNPGANDLQQLRTETGRKLFMETAANVIKWHKPGVGAVVGATNTAELEKITKFFAAAKKKIPLLIPGVGAQGGSAREVAAVLRKVGNDVRIHRINSSSGISCAYEKYGGSDYVSAAVKEVEKLNSEIGALT